MEKHSIHDVKAPLQTIQDGRGMITDIYYNDSVQHITLISSKSGAIRGNHYHKATVQSILMTIGKMEYWWKPLDSTEPAQMVIVEKDEIVTTPANEIHALRFHEDSEFIAFAWGGRGGKDYEMDTFRVESIIPEFKKKVLILGGYGFLGSAIAKQLEGKADVMRLGRQDFDFDKDYDKEALYAYFDNADVIINCIGLFQRDEDADLNKLFNANVKPNLAISEYILETKPSPLKTFVMIGSSSVHNKYKTEYELYAFFKRGVTNIQHDLIKKSFPVYLYHPNRLTNFQGSVTGQECATEILELINFI